MSDLLEVDIFTYSNLRWLQFSLKGLHPDVVNQNEAIYLYHKQQNHYDVVLKVTAKRANLNFFHNSNNDPKSKYNLRKQNRLRMKTKREYTGLKVPVDSIRNRKSALKEKYNNNTNFRMKMLEQKKDMYLNADFKYRSQMKDRNRYHENVEYRSNKIKNGTQKYALNCEYRNQVLSRSKNKYLLDLEYRKGKKDSLVRKYMLDDQHREHVKNTVKEKYSKNIEFKEKVKKRGIEKYKTDIEHRKAVKQAIKKKYEEDESYRMRKKLQMFIDTIQMKISDQKYKGEQLGDIKVILKLSRK